MRHDVCWKTISFWLHHTTDYFIDYVLITTCPSVFESLLNTLIIHICTSILIICEKIFLLTMVQTILWSEDLKIQNYGPNENKNRTAFFFFSFAICHDLAGRWYCSVNVHGRLQSARVHEITE